MTKSAAQHKLLTLNFLTRSCNALAAKIHKAVPLPSGGRGPPGSQGHPASVTALGSKRVNWIFWGVCDWVSCQISLLPLFVST